MHIVYKTSLKMPKRLSEHILIAVTFLINVSDWIQGQIQYHEYAYYIITTLIRSHYKE